MHICFFLVFVFEIFVDFKHYANTQAPGAPTKSPGPTEVAFAQKGFGAIERSADCKYQKEVAKPPFQRPGIPEATCCCDGGELKATLALPLVQAPQQVLCHGVWIMLCSMGKVHRHPLRSWAETKPIQCFTQVDFKESLGATRGLAELGRFPAESYKGLVLQRLRIAQTEAKESEESEKSKEEAAQSQLRCAITGSALAVDVFDEFAVGGYRFCSDVYRSAFATGASSGFGAFRSDSHGGGPVCDREVKEDHRIDASGFCQKCPSGFRQVREEAQESPASAASKRHTASVLVQLHRRVCEKMAFICRGFCQKRSGSRETRPGSKGAGSRGQDQIRLCKGSQRQTGQGSHGRSGRSLRYHGRGGRGQDGDLPSTPDRRVRRGAASQKSKTGAKCAGRSIWLWCWGASAFWEARQIDHKLEVCPGQMYHTFHQDAYVEHQWTHSIFEEPTFLSEWSASMKAIDLSFEVSQMQGKCFEKTPTTSLPTTKRGGNFRVRFHENVELYVGCEHDISLQRWNHRLTTSVSQSRLFQPLAFPIDDETSFMAQTGFHFRQGFGPFQPEHQELMLNPIIARDADQEEEHSESEHSEISEDDVSSHAHELRPDWFATLLFAVDFQAVPMRVNWNDYESMHANAATVLEIPNQHLYYLHHVRSAPRDLADAGVEPLIAHRHGDLAHGSILQLILLDVEFHSPNPTVQPEVVRRVVRMPRLIGRLTILQRLGLAEYCRRMHHSCIMWINGVIMSRFSARPLDLKHGDYLRIALPPGDDQVSHIGTRCIASACFQGVTNQELCDRHALFTLGWFDTIIGHPLVPLQEDDEQTVLLQQGPVMPAPALPERPWFLLTRPECRVHAVPIQHHAEEDPRDITRAFVDRLGDDHPGGLPPRPGLDEQPEFIYNLFQQLEEHGQVEVEEEGQVLYVNTWYLHAPEHVRCHEYRTVRLTSDFQHWQHHLLMAWRDRLADGFPIAFYLVFPQPPTTRMQPEILPHLILVQQEPPEQKAAVITVIDTLRPESSFVHTATFLPTQTGKFEIATALELLDRCYPAVSDLQCMTWHGEVQLQADLRIAIHHGVSFLLILQDIGFPNPRAWDEDEEMNLLQKHARPQSQHTQMNLHPTHQAPVPLQLNNLIPPSQERQTRGQVAHTHGPWENENEISIEDQTVAVQLLDLACSGTIPQFIETPFPGTAQQVEDELVNWGHVTKVFDCWPQPVFVCHPHLVPDRQMHHYLLCRNENQPGEDHEVFVHTHHAAMTDTELLGILCQLQYPRAVLLVQEQLHEGWKKVIFSHQEPQMQAISSVKQPGIWPPPFECQKTRGQPFFEIDQVEESTGSCLLQTMFTTADLEDFFQSGDEVLCQDFTCFEMPEEMQQYFALHNQTAGKARLTDFHRLLIFTDGTSAPEAKRLPPAHADENGQPDAWAFLAVGEYIDNQQHTYVPVGWTAQVVRYCEEGSHFNGIRRIGADMAERSALTWAALWRLSQNVDIETIFCVDSMVTGAQAFGSMSVNDADESFRILRGSIQALEAALPQGCVSWHHVVSHTGLIYNEFVDIVAKRESKQSFNLPRQKISMVHWRHIIPHLWMTFAGPRWGLPVWKNGGFEIPSPELPQQVQRVDEPRRIDTKHHLIHFAISLATANVHSLSRQPDGHAGKLHYLQEQMRMFKLNCIGVQEARTEAGVACRDNILRLCSGHQGKHLGVELWIDLGLPIGYDRKTKPIYLQRAEVQVVHTDPRRLLARVDNIAWSAWLCVLHAPHSGHTLQDREAWWIDTQHVISQYKDDAPIFMMMDANAPPGEFENGIVFQSGFATAANTGKLRDFLRTNQLCLPATGVCHVGDHGTWLDPSGDKLHFIDHIAIPTTWAACCTYSQVLQEFDMATTHEDHRALAIQLQWQEVVAVARVRKRRISNRSIDFTKAEFKDMILQYQPAQWNENIETHTEHFNQHIQCTLQQGAKASEAREQAKKCYIDDKIWNSRKTKLHHRAALKALRKQISKELLQQCFNQWRGDASSDGSYLNTLHCWNLKHWISFRRAGRSLRQELSQAKQRHLQVAMQQVTPSTSASDIIQKLKGFIGPTNPKKMKRKTLPMVCDETGQICSYPAEALGVWIDFFMQMEGGKRMTHSELREQWIHDLEEFACSSLRLPIHELPTLTDLELSYHRVQRGRACGPDDIPGELCHGQAAALAKATFAQLAKLYSHGQEFLGHKGGQLTPAFKGKGSTTSCSSYRSLLVSSHIGKVLHRTIRQSTAELYELFMQTQQVGGRRKVPVQLALHQVRAHMRRAARRKRSAGVLFLDLTEAFYRILREFAIGGSPTDELLAHVLHCLQMPSSAMHDIRAMLLNPCALQEAGLSQTAQNCIRAIHTGTFFWLDGQGDVARTSQGTRPGDSFADIIFGYAWALVLKKLEGFMIDQQLVEAMPEALQPGFFEECLLHHGSQHAEHIYIGPTWMDDLALCLEADSPQALESRIGQSTSCLLELRERHLMTPNLAKGKTEMLLVFRGPRSRHFTNKHYGLNASGLFPIAHEETMRFIQIVKRYKHLGGWMHHKQDQRVEIKQKAALAHETFSRHRKILFANENIAIGKRAELFTTLVLTKMLYGADSWFLATQLDKDRLHAAVIRLYKRLIKWKPDWNMTDEAIIVETGLPSPSELLRRARLRYLLVLLNCGIPHVWSLLNQDHEWCRLMEDDLVWMWEQLRRSSSLRDPRQHLPQWILLIQDHKSYWKGLVNRACQHAVLQRRKNFEACAFHQRIFERASQCLGMPRMSETSSENANEEVNFGCMQCRLACKSKAGEGAHMFRCHGQAAVSRQWYDEPSCPSCLKYYHTMAKMKAHLYYSRRCRQFLVNSNMNCVAPPGTGSLEDRRREEIHDFLLPPAQGFGPQLPCARERELVSTDDTFHLFMVELIDRRVALDEFGREFEQFATNHPISWTMWRSTILYFMDNFEETDANFFQYDLETLRRTFQQMASPSTWPFLRSQPNVVKAHNIEECHWHCHWMEQHKNEISFEVPKMFGKHRYVLHAFSGRRRIGDLQYFLERALTAKQTYVLHVISLDVIIDTTWGNVAKEATRTFWLQAIRSQWIIGFIAGPPCETWSRVRAVGQDLQGFHGPRVIRDLDNLWGHDCTSIKELHQLLVGNCLLSFSFEAMFEVLVSGGLGILEHPAEPDDLADAASIWRLPLMQWFLSLPGVRKLRFSQGLMGAPTPKPTDLLTVHMEHVLVHLHRCRVRVDLPHAKAVGRNAQGQWKTAILKEYPPSVCMAFADAFVEGMDRIPIDPSASEPPEAFSARCRPMECTEYGLTIGQDYAGWPVC